MKKAGSIVFQLNSSDFESKGKADRLLTFYKQLLRNRRLARFCKEAFIEKADRHLSGLEEQYTLLHSHIKSKGLDYILDAIREKETRTSSVVDEEDFEKAVQQILQALLREFHNEHHTPISLDPQEPIPLPKPKPDMVKLMALL
ncbi:MULTISPECIES: hypothetical protein [unclassified Paenibacillus]|uniref:hypothetical protein n=1 Tax=unclassified Paenibacillus TaxID=185978 RepID=UPI001AEAF4B0|nr:MULTISPECIES: hypothetical protein [unclassified Paenibacillus]MBP1153312.1 signal recognition particle GTPase [Paenibacillus sp. PvP091]MBP1171305.1 signal recognition particle GTPase [Paenibacillus sp. PvR098]MBP2442333.1 signal recognition particle GTPase [Paenibacillus sp. PvP052]